MNNPMRFLLGATVMVTAMSPVTSAHFKLLAPTSWITSNDLGDPQKIGPCGGDPMGQNEKLLTNAITKVMGGSKLHLTIQETIFPLRPLSRRSGRQLTKRAATGSVHG